ncbi:MAG: UDP-N-acetylmuramate:L-alanyl-gamma-D-glutamyl-meso-diaminopimelate ligase [Verrucomicrobia bacterium]|nr:UDP-N-acetylmuramate:L-alanyl-gamma-D-glutamyl-meso-diaminopimelate ligase [Verrucomicrobiota bacterium]
MHFHFIGICGTLMGSVAAALKQRGHTVTGSDQGVYPPMSTFLAAQGISIASPFAAENLPADPAAVIVIGNAMTRPSNPEVEAVLDTRRRYTSLPELLRTQILPGRRNFVVTGTHGKTTTSSLLAWMFESAGRQPSFLIGGIPKNLGQGARITDSELCVLEGDEYDTAFFDKRSKFVHYLPECVIMNNLEFDHADIFEDLNHVCRHFEQLVRIVPRNGLFVANADDANVQRVLKQAHAPILQVGLGAEGAGRISEIVPEADGTRFRIFGEAFFTPLAGEFNVRNCAVAIGAARHAGLSFDEIRAALRSFESVARRQEIRGVVRGVSVMDDFGHHPTAIAETLRALRTRWSRARIVAIFEPRSNTTRRAVFQHELAGAFADADVVVMAQVARLDQLPPDQRLDPERVIADLTASGKSAHYEATTAGIVQRAVQAARDGDLIVVFSNGGFDGIHGKLLAALAA